MSSNGEFSTISSGEIPSLPKSLPSSREATAEGNSSTGGGSFTPLREFLDRFSLPRVVRLEGTAGRPILLYKQQQRSLRVSATLLMHRYRHDVKVGPEIVIPEGYPGWFSVITGNNSSGNARVYRRVESLVRAGVPAFLLTAPLRAYTLTHSKMENGNLRAHYTKTTIRAGEVLRLVAVFQDTKKYSSMSFVISSSCSEKDQYAQCLDPHGREVFAPLSARGEFYAVCQNENVDSGTDAVLFKVHHLVSRQLPLRVRLIAGPLPVPLPREYGGLMQLESSTRGPIVLGCIVPERPVYNPEMLELMVTGNGAPRVRRARLGYPSEARLLASPKMQGLLTACSRAVGDRATEPRVAPLKMHDSSENLKEMHLKKIKPKAETKPILQSLRDGIEQLKKTTVRERSETRQQGNGFLDRISKLTQANRSRNPAKKSASFTFAIRPELAMKAQERYSSLEPETSQSHSNSSAKQPVQRSVSTSVLEVSADIEVQPNYSRVRDSLTPLPLPPKQTKPKPEDIYAEICEDPKPEVVEQKETKITKPQIQRQSRVQIRPQIRRERPQQRDTSKVEIQPLPRLRIDNFESPEIPPRFRIDNESPQILPRFKLETIAQPLRNQHDIIQPQILPRFQPQIQPRHDNNKPQIQPRFQTENQLLLSSHETESQIRIENKIQPRYQIDTEPQIHPRFQFHSDFKNSTNHVKARIKIIVKSKESYEIEQGKKEGRYINSVMITHSDPIINSNDDIIYNSIY
ncbi:uncharacterized protein LOC122512863 [Leptopilina heterotoma]|uniref:uncharacterized protein LOC122512863 n=1 Tax=Leptopilina heterotoma TaxID=63436 RepID=UPI001CA97A3E|nr:uncharacterized protein LOC122512863 [Leptopilina heterotoma]XP_043484901.1 uncharacterized protein LOC122512863 [Leptopilina heterotoma]XP_043484902.1 uncharacterized protein LOC122512863 [Leptopilina heterotoma]